MSIKKISSFFLFGSLFAITGCSDNPRFLFFCEKDKVGNYTLKWEVSPKKPNDQISIYMSDKDSVFAEPPIVTTRVSDYIATIPTNDSIGRKFFRLKVDKSFSGIISNRCFKLDSLQNFRDVGGYSTREGDQMRWGKLFRSGELNEISTRDTLILRSLDIKTIIDFRDYEERELYPNRYHTEKTYLLPILTGNRAYIREKIINGSFLRGDAIIFTQDTYKMLIENHTDEYSKFFDILCDENNYPILFHGHLGKDRVGLANYFLLKALGVSDDTNEDDYLLSNSCIREQEVIGEAKFLPEQMQEAATIVCQARMSYLNYAKTCMQKKSGSVEEYMRNELDLTPEKVEKLKKILLYP